MGEEERHNNRCCCPLCFACLRHPLTGLLPFFGRGGGSVPKIASAADARFMNGPISGGILPFFPGQNLCLLLLGAFFFSPSTNQTDRSGSHHLSFERRHVLRCCLRNENTSFFVRNSKRNLMLVEEEGWPAGVHCYRECLSKWAALSSYPWCENFSQSRVMYFVTCKAYLGRHHLKEHCNLFAN